jgi:hypothetical protein
MRKEDIFIQRLVKSYLDRKEGADSFLMEKKLFDHKILVEKIFSNGLEGICYYELNRLGTLYLFAPEFVEKLKWGARNTLIVNLLLYDEFLTILNEFKKNKIQVIPVKGIYFAKKIYEDYSLRPMADIDLFVRDDNYESAIAILKKIGYKESDFLPVRKWERENFRIALTRQNSFPLTVEIHKRFAHPGRFELSVSDALLNLEPVKIGDEEIETFNPTYTFLMLIHHLGMHYFNVKLIWVVDLIKFLYKHNLDWDKINNYVYKYKLKTVFYMAMNLIKPYTIDSVIPVNYSIPGFIKRKYLEIFFTNNSLNFFRFPTMNIRLAQLFAEVPLIDNWKDRFRFLKNYLKIRIYDYL